jgi:DNA-binding NarL/FixJ family response regulator
VAVEIGTVPAERLSQAVEGTAYFVVSEALANVAKHAQATSGRVSVTLEDGRLKGGGHGRRSGRRRRRCRIRPVRLGRPPRGVGWAARGAQPAGGGDTHRGRAAVRIAVADDSALFRMGLARVLEDAGIEVTGQAANAAELLALIEKDPPQVAITDIRMPPTMTDEGIALAREIRSRFPSVGVLVLSTYVDSDFAFELVSRGGARAGYLLKDRVADVQELVEALRRIEGGGSVLDPEVVGQILARSRVRNPLDQLTDREREVLSLMAEGRSNQAICQRLWLSPRTVETHVSSIFAKLSLPPAPDDNRRVLAVLAHLASQGT